MHQAIPCSNTRAWPRPADLSAPPPLRHSGGVRQVVQDNPVVVVGRKGCCMSHVVRRLLLGLGVNPTAYEVPTEEEAAVAREVFGSGDVTFPVVFIGGKLLGGLDRLMAVHISGELVPILKAAGALWL
ncbi:Glutaredoxin family protein [Rhynchospora pubera]|uniref:Glutaredoxin family protein n=1 Tax=Rhynchospora pubera TaxID=906938 RepID=A0AAV8DR42_9POAL|nr:Glutaredoxin family protein [Rhynchospora pubera]KAJ4821625.1 Glutaredoxin family protein [Rhynchospora pubera]